jgi:mannan endo-1,4-beta-mannosidase
MKKNYCFFLAFLIGLSASFAQSTPTDPQANTLTKQLYNKLQSAVNQGIMLGHQDDLAYGVSWKYKKGNSDIKLVTGQYPAVFGWDLGHIELDKAMNLDSVPFQKMKEFIQNAYEWGGINTISWHLNNPVNGKSSWDKTVTVKHLLPSGSHHQVYKKWLGKVAKFFKSLKDKNGKAIPIIFRPYHEHTGSWFWWGRDFCTPEEYKALWQMTVKYFRNQKVNNLLYAYSTDYFANEADYLERYPGDEWVDILGFDFYHRNAPQSNAKFIEEVQRMIKTVENLANQKNKVAAWTETGLEGLPLTDWWTEVLYKAIQDSKIAYVLVWRNANQQHFYAPYPAQPSAEDFKLFSQKEKIWLIQKTANAKMYD